MERFVEFSFELLLQMDKHLPGMSGEDTEESEVGDDRSESSSDDNEVEEKHKKSK